MSKLRNNEQWTEARFHSFIKSALRAASNRWPPKYEVKRASRTSRGQYLCAGYEEDPHIVPAKEIVIDHINPVVDPETGFTTWDDMIERMFCEAEGLQPLCRTCHQRKTNNERDLRRRTRSDGGKLS